MIRIHVQAFSGLLLLVFALTKLEGATRLALLQTNPEHTGAAIALLEAKLIHVGNIELVERQEIDAILREQKLSALLDANAVSARAAVGKALKADLLVVLQGPDDAEKSVNVVICETRQGLRLLREAYAGSNNEANVTELLKFIDAAVEMHRQPIRELFAVPAFVNNDLGFDCDHLKGAYAKVVESVLVAQPSVRVVELVEARAIAKEISLAADENIRRPLPLYVLGEFRHDGKGDERRVRIALKLMRGERELHSLVEELPPDRAVTFIREAAGSFLNLSAVGPQPAADPKREVQQLNQRAQQMLTLGSWRESLDLFEASLLLDPDQPAARCGALTAIRQLRDRREREMNNLYQVDEWQVAYYRRAMEHLEPHLRATTIDYDQCFPLVPQLFFRIPASPRGASAPSDRDKAVYQSYLDARNESLQMYLQVLDEKARRRVIDDTAMLLWVFERGMPIDRPAMFARRLKILSQFIYLPKLGAVLGRIEEFPIFGFHEYREWQELVIRPDRLEFLKQVRELPNEDLRRIADELIAMIDTIRARMVKEQAAAAKPFVERKLPPVADAEVAFTPLAFDIEGARSENPPRLSGCVPAGERVDLFWSGSGLYLMKQQGELRQIDQRNFSTRDYEGVRPCFDGKFVWATRTMSVPGTGIPSCQLLVIDPESERVEELGVDDGLPACSVIEVAPLAAGRVLLVGYFGQAFAAVVTFDVQVGATVKTIHEFRHMPKAGDSEQWRDSDLAFSPGKMVTLSEPGADGTTKQLVMVWRKLLRVPEAGVDRRPLFINPADGALKVMNKVSYFDYPQRIAEDGGVCYHLDAHPSLSVKWQVFREIRVSQIHQRVIPAVERNPLIFAHGGALHVIDQEWSVAAKDKGEFRKLRGNVPTGKPYESAHYGLLLFGKERRRSSSRDEQEIYHVTFPKALPEMTASDAR
jgi:hypothetical protein